MIFTPRILLRMTHRAAPGRLQSLAQRRLGEPQATKKPLSCPYRALVKRPCKRSVYSLAQTLDCGYLWYNTRVATLPVAGAGFSCVFVGVFSACLDQCFE
jgi:hypothetical protein